MLSPLDKMVANLLSVSTPLQSDAYLMWDLDTSKDASCLQRWLPLKKEVKNGKKGYINIRTNQQVLH